MGRGKEAWLGSASLLRKHRQPGRRVARLHADPEGQLHGHRGKSGVSQAPEHICKPWGVRLHSLPWVRASRAPSLAMQFR